MFFAIHATDGLSCTTVVASGKQPMALQTVYAQTSTFTIIRANMPISVVRGLISQQ